MSFFCSKRGFAVFLNIKFTRIKKGHFFPNSGFATAYAIDNTGIHFQKNMHKTHLEKTFLSKITCRTMRCDPILWYFVNFHFSYA